MLVSESGSQQAPLYYFNTKISGKVIVSGIRPLEEKNKYLSVDDLRSRIIDNYEAENPKPVRNIYPLGSEDSHEMNLPDLLPLLTSVTSSVSNIFHPEVSSDGITNNSPPFIYESLIDQILPKDVFGFILSLLDANDLHAVRSVSSYWAKVSLDMAKRLELFLFKSFHGFLQKNLDIDYPDLKKTLNESINTDSILGAKDLLEVRSALLDLREKILNVLKNLRDEDLISMALLSDNESTPLFFDKIFYLVEIYKKIDKAFSLKDKKELSNISIDLCEMKNFDKAIEVLNKSCRIQSPPNQQDSYSIRAISIGLCEKGNFDRAFEVAYSKTDALKTKMGFSGELERTLFDILEKFCEAGQLNLAVRLLENFQSKYHHACGYIANSLYKDGKFEKNIIPMAHRSSILIAYISVLAQENKCDEAMKLLDLIEDETLKNSARVELSATLRNHLQMYENATILLESITDQSLKHSELLSHAFSMSSASEDITAIKVLDSLRNVEMSKRKYVLNYILSQLCASEKSNKAIKLLELINDQSLKNEGLQIIAFQLLEVGDFEGAIKLIEHVTDVSIQLEAIKYAFEKLREATAASTT